KTPRETKMQRLKRISVIIEPPSWLGVIGRMQPVHDAPANGKNGEGAALARSQTATNTTRLANDRPRYPSSAPVESAINSDRSRTRIFSSIERAFIASSIRVMQKGHPTASVSGSAALNWSKRVRLIGVPSRSSSQKHPPPAPQQNVRFLHK